MPNHKIGLIGAGEFGNFASQVIWALPDFVLCGVVDTNEKAASTLAETHKAKIYRTYLDLLKDKEIDVVMINTPNFLHARMVKDALKYKKRILCEKPLGISEEEANEVRKALINNKGILLVNFLQSRSKIYGILKNVIKNKTYGEFKYAHIENLATESTIKSPWYWQKEKSGGWFLTADIHFYDLMLYLFDEQIKLVSAFEYSSNRTTAIFTNLAAGNFPINIFHDFTADYKRVDFTAKFIFEKADITIKGWIPTAMIIRSGSKEEKIVEKEDRELIYHKLIAENFRKLVRMTHQESLKNIEKVMQSSKIAFEAQKIADSEERKTDGKN